jgi:hypothetical protein
MNHVKRGNLIHRKWTSFKNPVAISLDAARFDKHVDVEMLRIEHWVYCAMAGFPSDFAHYLKWQINNVCFSLNNICYFVKGKRMSGDLNTAVGNCILSVLMAMCWLDSFTTRYDFLDDGDDLLVFLEQHDLEKALATVKPFYLQFGHEMKIENIATTIEQVNFCRSHPVFDGQNWRMVRHYLTVMSTALAGTKFANVPQDRLKFVAANGWCELSVGQGLPIMQAFAEALLRNSPVDPGDLLDDDMFRRCAVEQHRLHNLRPRVRPVTNEARASFSRAYGVSVAEQLEIEQALMGWTFCTSGGLDVGADLDQSWTRIQTMCPELAAGGALR